MYKKDVTKQLKELKKIQPDKDWAAFVRSNLVENVEADSARSSLGMPRFGVSVALAMFAFLFVGGALAQNSLPGSPMYSVKLAVEDLQRTITRDPVAAANLNAVFAERRLEETSRVAERDLESQDATELSEQLASYRQEIEEAKTSGNNEEIQRAVEEVTETTEIVNDTIRTSRSSDPGELEKTIRENVNTLLADCNDEEVSQEAKQLVDGGSVKDFLEALKEARDCSLQEHTEEDNENQNDEQTTTTPITDEEESEEESTSTQILPQE